jgi:hypothetical protein
MGKKEILEKLPWGVPFLVGSLVVILIVATLCRPELEITGPVFTGLLAIFTACLWKTNQNSNKIQQQFLGIQQAFNKWTKEQYEPKPGIVDGELSHDRRDITIQLEMINPGQTVIFYKATKLNECPISRFLVDNRFGNNVGIKPYEVGKIFLKSPIKGDVAELEKFLEDSDQFLLDINEEYYSGKELDEQHVWNITFRKKDGKWKIMALFLSDVQAAGREKGR